MKKGLSLLMALLLMLGTLGCFGASAEEEFVITREALGLPELEFTSDVVTYLGWDNQKSVNNWAANLLMQEVYGIKLKTIRTTYAEISSKAASLRLSGQSPDLIKFRSQEMPAFIRNDVVADVTDWLDFDDPLWAGLKETADMYAYQDRYYLFPTGKVYNNSYIYYWTSYFEDLGLETPLELYENGEWTLSTLGELGKELTQDFDRDGIVDIYGFAITPGCSHMITGEDYVSYDPETGLYSNNLRSPALAEYYNFYYDTGSAGDNSRIMSLEEESCFDSKQCVMMLQEQWLMGTYYDKIVSGEIGVAPAPRLDSLDEYHVHGRVAVYWVGKDSPNPNGALAYLACERALALNEGLADELKRRAGIQVQDWPEEIEALIDEMNDQEKFIMHIPISGGVGTWGDDSAGIYNMLSEVSQFEVPWPTIVEKQYPLLQQSIDVANDIFE
ncbi:MAG: hypothetical protein E7324_00115 [Clostridiales bacterium]|nr:hypothetical protein [Clostridiales bacterium]